MSCKCHVWVVTNYLQNKTCHSSSFKLRYLIVSHRTPCITLYHHCPLQCHYLHLDLVILITIITSLQVIFIIICSIMCLCISSRSNLKIEQILWVKCVSVGCTCLQNKIHCLQSKSNKNIQDFSSWCEVHWSISQRKIVSELNI